jgi:hypothetical protein
MKRIRIRHCGDKGMYFGEFGWSLNSESARVFTTPLEAITFVIQKQIGNAELVAEENQKEEIAVSI